MYSDAVPRIAAYAAEEPTHLYRVGFFVQATINRHFELVPRVMQEGPESPLLMGRQKQALHALEADIASLHATLFTHEGKRRISHSDALQTILRLQGYGFAKGGFFLQLLGFDVGCLDRHNLRLAGLAETAFSWIPREVNNLVAKVQEYLGVCRAWGDCCLVGQLVPPFSKVAPICLCLW